MSQKEKESRGIKGGKICVVSGRNPQVEVEDDDIIGDACSGVHMSAGKQRKAWYRFGEKKLAVARGPVSVFGPNHFPQPSSPFLFDSPFLFLFSFLTFAFEFQFDSNQFLKFSKIQGNILNQ
jgi:hypothetical protein